MRREWGLPGRPWSGTSSGHLSKYVRKRGERLTRCSWCVGKALRLPPDDTNITSLCRSYSIPGSDTRHFKSAHLDKKS